MPWRLQVRDSEYRDRNGRVRNARFIGIPALPAPEALPDAARPLVDKIEKLRSEAKRLQDEATEREQGRGKVQAEYERQLAQSVTDDKAKAPPTDMLTKYDEETEATKEKANVLLRAAGDPLRQLGEIVIAHQSELIAQNREAAQDAITEVTDTLDDLDTQLATLGQAVALYRWSMRLRPDRVDRVVGSQLTELTKALDGLRRQVARVEAEVTPAKKKETANA